MPARNELSIVSRRRLLATGTGGLIFLLGCQSPENPETPQPIAQPTNEPKPIPSPVPSDTPLATINAQPQPTSTEIPAQLKPTVINTTVPQENKFPTAIPRRASPVAYPAKIPSTSFPDKNDTKPFLTSTPYVPPSPTAEREISLTQIIEAKPGVKIEILWEKLVGSSSFMPNYKSDDKYCYAFNSSSRNIIARELQTGKPVWEERFPLQRLEQILLDPRDPEIIFVNELDKLTAYRRDSGKFIWSQDFGPFKPPGMNMQLEYHHKIFSLFIHKDKNNSFIAFDKLNARELKRASGQIGYTTDKVSVIRPYGDKLEGWHTDDLLTGKITHQTFKDLPQNWQLHGFHGEENLFFTDIFNPSNQDEYISSCIDLHSGALQWKIGATDLPGEQYNINSSLARLKINPPQFLYILHGKNIYTRLGAVDKLSGKIVYVHNFNERIGPNSAIGEAQGTLLFSNNKTKELAGINPLLGKSWKIKDFGDAELVGTGYKDIIVVRNYRESPKTLSLFGLHKSTGQLMWQEDLPLYVADYICFGKYTAYLLLTQRKIIMLDTQSGEKVYEAKTPGDAHDIKQAAPDLCLVYSSAGTSPGGLVTALRFN